MSEMPAKEMDHPVPDQPAEGQAMQGASEVAGGETAAALEAAVAADSAKGQAAAQESVQEADFSPLRSTSAAPQVDPGSIALLLDVPLRVTVELGRARMPVRQVLEIQNGTVVELDKLAGDAVDVYVNDQLMARGEVVVVDDRFGVRITQVVARGADAGPT